MIFKKLIGFLSVNTFFLLSQSAIAAAPDSISTLTNSAEKSKIQASGKTDVSADKVEAVSSGERMTEFIMLSVDKATMQAKLKTWPADKSKTRILKTYKFAMGKSKGDKEREGDNRTPEGIYFAQKHIPGSKLLRTKYGPWAIPLDFPNPIDRLDGKTGYGIWLHGAGNDERIAKTNVTEGCVAFYNKDITKLSSWLEPFQALVVIAKDIKEVNKEDELEEVTQRTQNWISAWKSRNVEDYISFYSDKFKLKGRKKASYGEYKSRVFKSYKVMKVGISQLRVVTHPKYAVAIMNQDFDGDGHFISNGRKVLFWDKNESGEWQIVREMFSNRRIVPTAFGPKEIQLLKAEVGSVSAPDSPKTPVASKS